MYKLLVATDKPEIINAIESVKSWESLGFRTPRVVSSAQAAQESLKKHHADGLMLALPQEEENLLMPRLIADYPLLPICEAASNQGDVVDIVCELRSLLNRTHADFSNDNFGEADMMQICRHEFFRALIDGRIKTQHDILRRLRLLRSRMDPDKACVLLELHMPPDAQFLRGRWHYGADRLEVALRNFFGAELEGMRILVSVLPDERVYLLACPMLGEEVPEGNSISGMVASHAEESIEHVREYLDLDLTITGVRVLTSIKALATERQ